MGRRKTGIEDFLDRVRRKLKPEKIILFGSRARGGGAGGK
jgi:predicted nucleotidyltransferase